MANKKETVEIPVPLARVLVARKSDYNDEVNYEAVQEVAKSLLRLLIEMK